MMLLLFIVFLGEFSMNWRRMERLQKWRRMVRQQKGKLYIMRICITMLICRLSNEDAILVLLTLMKKTRWRWEVGVWLLLLLRLISLRICTTLDLS
ncbi:unnamed protein product [Musa acuminata subsp. burmannicoides]